MESRDEDPDVARAKDERLLLATQRDADADMRRGDHESAIHRILACAKVLRDPRLVAFARGTLVDCYRDSRSYESRSSVRASSMTSLSALRQLDS